MRNTRTTTTTLAVCVFTHKKKKMRFIFLAARSAVVLRGPVDQTKILRKDQSCRGEEDGTKQDFCDTMTYVWQFGTMQQDQTGLDRSAS